jgi:hypothetical protein
LQGPCGPAQTILFVGDRAGDPALTDAQLRAVAAAGNQLTYTCAPPGTGARMAIDRDEDGALDQDEEDAGSDPADPGSIPGGPVDVAFQTRRLLIKNKNPDDESRNKIVLVARDAAISVPALNVDGDPRCGLDAPGTVKATLTIASASSGELHQTDLPCQNWKMIGSPGNHKGYRYRDRELDDGTAKVVVWRAGRLLKAVLQGKGTTNLDYDLVTSVSQGTVSTTLASGSSSYCGACGAHNGRDGSDGKKFLGKRCPAPASCS